MHGKTGVVGCSVQHSVRFGESVLTAAKPASWNLVDDRGVP